MSANINSVQFFKDNTYALPNGIKAPILIAWELVTPENYGSLLRLADTIGFEKVIFVCQELRVAEKKIEKVAGNSYKVMPFEFVKPADLDNALPEGYQLVAIETADRSTNIFQTQLPQQVALVVGSERHGVNLDFLATCSQIVHIPLTGKCSSLNVSHAAAVAMFEWLRQIAF